MIHQKPLFTLATLVALMAVVVGCEPDRTSHDPVAMHRLPPTARLVSHGETPDMPLFFEAPCAGEVAYVGNGDVLATLRVAEGQRVRLNEWPGARRGPGTQLSLDDQTVYSASSRCGDNRLYFMPRQ